jgi:pre-mRNA-processing factor SLU7
VRGLASGPSATKFRKGACSNCGALTHAKADCLDRPRAKGARWTQADIRPDELLAADLKLNYDGKRDRFAGFDGAQYAALVAAKFSAEEGARKSHVLAQQLQALEASEAAGAAAGGDEDDGLRVRDDETSVAAREGGGTRQGAHKMSVRNLRIREDTAKYLLNLDANSAYYDPKTRSMRENPRPENPTPGADDADAGGAFVGDNFVRHRGETLGFYGLQVGWACRWVCLGVCVCGRQLCPPPRRDPWLLRAAGGLGMPLGVFGCVCAALSLPWSSP